MNTRLSWRLVAGSAVAIAMLSSTPTAVFAAWNNGLSMNGLRLSNGLSVNGLRLSNGLSVNGLRLSNGLAIYGLGSNAGYRNGLASSDAIGGCVAARLYARARNVGSDSYEGVDFNSLRVVSIALPGANDKRAD